MLALRWVSAAGAPLPRPPRHPRGRRATMLPSRLAAPLQAAAGPARVASKLARLLLRHGRPQHYYKN